MIYALLHLIAQEEEKAPTGSPFSMLTLFVPILIIFYLLIILPAQRRDRKQREMLNQIEVNDEVLTAAGVFGQVKALNEEEVTVKVDDNTRLRMQRSSIVRNFTKEAQANMEAGKQKEQKKAQS